MNYAEKLKDPHWQKKRLKVMERDGWKCQSCGGNKNTLQIHHKKYNGPNPWDTNMGDLVCICSLCYTYISDYSLKFEEVSILRTNKSAKKFMKAFFKLSEGELSCKGDLVLSLMLRTLIVLK